MKKLSLLFAAAALACAPQDAPDPAGELDAWQDQAERIEIMRDDWGIPHVYGPTDADVVFGMVYAQAEDDYPRIELNYLNSLGRLAEAEGESAHLDRPPHEALRRPRRPPGPVSAEPSDLAPRPDGQLGRRAQLLPRTRTPRWSVAPSSATSPGWPLSFTEGSIGGDIERISTRGLRRDLRSRRAEAQRGQTPRSLFERPDEAVPVGDSDPGAHRLQRLFAIAPSNTADGNALLLINPHTSFYFRAEVHMVSERGY